jgi:hypothetical protein
MSASLRYPNGQPVECVIADIVINGLMIAGLVV